MKSTKDTATGQEIQLELAQLVLVPNKGSGEAVVGLELKMTNAAFGFEYAMEALDRESLLSMQSDKIQMELDCFKKDYFLARDELKTIDTDRVMQLEEQLRLLKLHFFNRQQYLH